MEITAEIKAALDGHSAAIDAAITKFEGQVKDAGTVSIEAKAEVKALSEKFEAALTEIAQKMEVGFERKDTPLTAGQEAVKSEAFKAFVEGGSSAKARIEVKNTILSDATTVLATQRQGIVPGSFLPLTIRQVIPSIQVSGNSIEGLKENTWTNSAAEASQGVLKLESDLVFAAYDVPIRTIAHWIKASKQLLADAPAVASYIDIRLRDGLAQRVDKQLILGNGTSPNLSGLTDSGNYTAFTADSGANLVDSINKAKYAMWATGNPPDTVICNPADWGAMEVLREGSGTGMYLYGSPGTNAGQNPFGLQLVLSNHITAGNFIVAKMSDSAIIYNREGAVIEFGYVNTDFTQNLVTIRAEERLGLGVDRPAGIWYGDFSL